MEQERIEELRMMCVATPYKYLGVDVAAEAKDVLDLITALEKSEARAAGLQTVIDRLRTEHADWRD